MKKILYLLMGVILFGGLYYSCVPEELPGSIYGTVVDKATGEPIKSAGVELSPSGLKTVTGSEGQFEFTELNPGKYTLIITKTGYVDGVSGTIEVKPGQQAKGDVQIEKLPPSLRVVDDKKNDIDTLDFGSAIDDVARSFSVFNDGTETLEWQITVTADWIKSVSKIEGVLSEGATQSLIVTIDRDKLNLGENKTTTHITSNSGSKQLIVTATNNYQPTTLNVLSVTDIKSSYAMLHGEILTEGTPKYTERGFVYSESSKPTIGNCIQQLTTPLTVEKAFSTEVTGLIEGRTYYVRAYAINGGKEAYSSNEVSFTPVGTSLPIVATESVTNISKLEGKATFLGNIISIGDPAYTKRGFIYGLLHNPTIEHDTNIIVAGNGTGEYIANAEGLQLGNVYYIRAYAENSLGIAYGEEVTADFSPSLPIVTTNDVEVVPISDTEGSAIFNANIKDAGIPTYTERGFVYSLVENPTINIANKVIVEGIGLVGPYSTTIKSLEVNKNYFVRAYLIHSQGVVYGEGKLFNIQVVLSPTVITSSVTDITYNSAIVNGNVSFDGGAEVTERGVCYSTSPNPTTSDTKVTAGIGGGAFSAKLTGLSIETTYYVRAYAINNKGISYGEQISFQTKKRSTPTIATLTAKNITYTTATIEAEVRDDGGSEVTERGICYSISSNPIITDSKVIVGSGVGFFTANLTNLSVETTYYVRAYATNAKGTSYGEEINFQTNAYSLPIVSTAEVTYITNSSAIAGGNVMSDGGTEVTERGICYSLSSNPTISDSKLEAGKGEGFFSVKLNNLEMATTYYVRAYAVNSKGINYGEQTSFQTITGTLPDVTTISVVNIDYHSATVNGIVNSSSPDEIIEYGVCYSIAPNPTTSATKIMSGKGVGIFYTDLIDLLDGTTYYVRTYAINNIGTAYGEELSFTTKDRTYENGYEYVDLGLSVKWATMNIGATKPEEVGDLFAWGDIIPNRGGSWENYVHCYDSDVNFTKYCTDSNRGVKDDKSILEPMDDAAHIHWGGKWRMPTIEECQELLENCTIYQENNYYYKFVSRKAGYTDKSIIFVCYEPYGKYYLSECWTSNLAGNIGAYILHLHSDFRSEKSITSNIRCSLNTIRPVCP